MSAMDDIVSSTKSARDSLDTAVTSMRAAGTSMSEQKAVIGQAIGWFGLAEKINSAAETVGEAAGLVHTARQKVDGVLASAERVRVADEKSKILAALAADGHSLTAARTAARQAFDYLGRVKGSVQRALSEEQYESAVVGSLEAAEALVETSVMTLTIAIGDNETVQERGPGAG